MRVTLKAIAMATFLTIFLPGCGSMGDIVEARLERKWHQEWKPAIEARWETQWKPQAVAKAQEIAVVTADAGIDKAESGWNKKLAEIQAKPAESLSDAERWLLYINTLTGGGALAFTGGKTAVRSLIGAAAKAAMNGGNGHAPPPPTATPPPSAPTV